jgi:hypothetical protein
VDFDPIDWLNSPGTWDLKVVALRVNSNELVLDGGNKPAIARLESPENEAVPFLPSAFILLPFSTSGFQFPASG